MLQIKLVSQLPKNWENRSAEEIRLLWDSLEFQIEPTEGLDLNPGYLLFDNEEEFKEAILARNELQNPTMLMRHELAHAECMRALGQTAIRYGLIYDDRFPGRNLVSNAVTLHGESVIWPNLAYVATYAAPSDRSRIDKQVIWDHGYPSIQYLTDRIELWNNSDHGLTIPMPGSLEIDT